MDIGEEIRKLHELHQSGALTDEEFAKAKAAILSTVPDKLQARRPVSDPEPGFVSSPQQNLSLQHREPTNNPWALAGFVLGLLSIILFMVGIIPLLAIVFGIVGLVTYDNRRDKNHWMAPLALVLGGVFTFAMLVFYGHIK